MKPKLKPPGTERLKPEHEKLVSNFASNFNLRRYTEAAFHDGDMPDGLSPAGAYTRPLFSST
jgi:hypothetical protein